MNQASTAIQFAPSSEVHQADSIEPEVSSVNVPNKLALYRLASGQSNISQENLGEGSQLSELASPLLPIEEVVSDPHSIHDVAEKSSFNNYHILNGERPKNNADVHSLVAKFIEANPPLPMLPKSYNMPEDLPRSGGGHGFLKLTKFRGQDYGKSKI